MTTLKKYSIKTLRAKIIRKGMFSQLPYLEKGLEKENRLFRAVLDKALYDLTSKKTEDRNDIIFWLNPNNEDFKEVCRFAGLNPLRTYNMFLFFLTSFFKEPLRHLRCHQAKNGGIVEFSPELTLLSQEEIQSYLKK